MIDLISVCLNNSLLKSTGHCFRTLHIFTLQFSDKKIVFIIYLFFYYYLLSLRLNHIKLAGVTAETSSSAQHMIRSESSDPIENIQHCLNMSYCTGQQLALALSFSRAFQFYFHLPSFTKLVIGSNFSSTPNISFDLEIQT